MWWNGEFGDGAAQERSLWSVSWGVTTFMSIMGRFVCPFEVELGKQEAGETSEVEILPIVT